MSKSHYIRNTKQGLAQYYRTHMNQTTGDRERLPVTTDMISKYYAPHAANPTIAQQAVHARRNVDWLHGHGPRIGISTDPERDTFADH